VEFCILLAAPSVVTSIVLIVSSRGYTSQDVPIVSSHLPVDDHLYSLSLRYYRYQLVLWNNIFEV
jgi:hypothetical protein